MPFTAASVCSSGLFGRRCTIMNIGSFFASRRGVASARIGCSHYTFNGSSIVAHAENWVQSQGMDRGAVVGYTS